MKAEKPIHDYCDAKRVATIAFNSVLPI